MFGERKGGLKYISSGTPKVKQWGILIPFPQCLVMRLVVVSHGRTWNIFTVSCHHRQYQIDKNYQTIELKCRIIKGLLYIHRLFNNIFLLVEIASEKYLFSRWLQLRTSVDEAYIVINSFVCSEIFYNFYIGYKPTGFHYLCRFS